MNNQNATKLFVYHFLLSIVLGISLTYALLGAFLLFASYFNDSLGLTALTYTVGGIFIFFIAGNVAFGSFMVLQSNIKKILFTSQFFNKSNNKIFLYVLTLITFLCFSIPLLMETLSEYHLV